MLNELAKLLHIFFATDQSYYAEQQADGTYRKKPGLVTPAFLEKNLRQAGSIAIYQKNSDTTVQWICFDFDILKANLEPSKIDAASSELKRCVSFFCTALEEMEIPYLLETSGNRGFHVWITFKEKISYRIGYDIQQALLEHIDLCFNKEFIAIDLFPSSSTPTDGVGLGVKIPLSKHRKSGKYSQILESPDEIDSYTPTTELDENLVHKHITILRSHSSTSKSDIENSLGIFFDLSHDETLYPTRIKSIKTQNNGFSIEDLITHWSNHPPLNLLKSRIFEDHQLNNDERKLLVGIFGNLTCKNIKNINTLILISIFSQTKNYNPERTKKSIKALSSFYFPSQEQIEKTTGLKFTNTLTTEELLEACIPKYAGHEDATFELSEKDIAIARTAELNYLFLNDEAQSRTVINDLSSCDNEELLTYAKNLLINPKAAQHYKHTRNEGAKKRTLITLKAPERILTSCILKQLIYFLDIQPNQNSHGYKPNKGFSGGHIFQPWLYLWIKFVSNISNSIEDPNNADYYIVKTDIKSFYDKIPHDNLKRLLLGGMNSRIDIRRNQLSGAAEEQYKLFISTLFEITKTITNSNIGLPQGPAYARYLAELYLDNIDNDFDSRIKNGELYLYQRYVDDIFFISPSEQAANDLLKKLTQELELLGLTINTEKTTVTKIRNFSEDFKTYRSQSKYAVDRVSKNFADATETQQNLAINEFMTLVQSDSCEDDLAFIFSHLNGVPELDEWKNEKVIPTINSGIGRGTLYRHLFNFVLDNRKNWKALEEIGTLTELQSEVLTSAFINALDTNKVNARELNSLFESIQEKLSHSEMVVEHLTYLATTYCTNIDIKKLAPRLIINCLSSAPAPENLVIPSPTVAHLNTALNDIKSLSEFTRAMYPICASSNLTKADLNSLASIFYAKLSSDESKNKLSISESPEINTSATASKFYYLLCLFSASNKNSSPDLLKSMWKYCAHIYNLHDTESTSHTSPNWFKKIDDIEIDEAKAHLIISAIVDGNIFRGLEDNKKVFERFHNLLLLFITFKNNRLYDENISAALETLKDKALFYSWLIDRKNVSLFPSSITWFEKNVVENNSIILKKDNTILFRKPTPDFHESSTPSNEHNGYSEIVEAYDSTLLRSLDDLLGELTVKERLQKLISIINYYNNTDVLPNIYCNERILDQDTLLPFSNELTRSAHLIFENHNGDVNSFTNNQKNFISCFFETGISGRYGEQFKFINEKYIANLDNDIDTLEFLKKISIQLEEIENTESRFYFDVSASAALHLSMSEMDPIRRIERFVTQYHKFNPSAEDRHIYGIDEHIRLSEETPLDVLDAVEISVKAIPEKSVLSLALYLDKDIAHYKAILQKLADRRDTDAPTLDLRKFRRAYHKILQTIGAININGINHKFSEVKLFNVIGNNLQTFEASHTIILNTSEHVYYFQEESTVYVIALQSSISKIYRSIEQRASTFSHDGMLIASYPDSSFDRDEIVSLEKFHLAKDVISIHRDISKHDAEQLLLNWLKFLPRKFHRPIVILLSAHAVMHKEEIRNFLSKVKILLETKDCNPFVIKRISDFNGTHRILYKEGDIGRNVDSLSPINIDAEAKRATIITDNIITGSQITSALQYYATGIGYKKSANYFELTSEEMNNLQARLKKLEHLDICTVLYTQKAIEHITQACKNFLNNGIEVNIIQGRDIGDDALFGTTQKIGESDKSSIRELFNDSEAMQTLNSHLNTPSTSRYATAFSIDDINKINLVTRFQSLPKKCFSFLCLGLKHDATCYPLVRVRERNE
ncbi:hypothetical protein WP8S17C03_47580 [Metapseudomonas otitidis]|uniref:Reverse transcriptase domain-containing protein n=1 Tax=Metapseudomonas otitidis TaxID=319939 RepID=A0A6S5S2Z4_9GAMM|nr:reverse transcriptase domain-containing protein [Pseudomonas otitidis]BBT18709.1 hypothetical protein WP8S17C03_47580 [Pseudomonas otitidis]